MYLAANGDVVSLNNQSTSWTTIISNGYADVSYIAAGGELMMVFESNGSTWVKSGSGHMSEGGWTAFSDGDLLANVAVGDSDAALAQSDEKVVFLTLNGLNSGQQLIGDNAAASGNRALAIG